uniref:Kinesin family member 26Ba n=1 Tax=Oncorhynchus tshawytscha TaxID=74940 RepID=A0AAZ3RRL3_ONCTS
MCLDFIPEQQLAAVYSGISLLTVTHVWSLRWWEQQHRSEFASLFSLFSLLISSYIPLLSSLSSPFPSSPILPSSLLPFFSLPLLSSPLLSSLSSPFPSSPILPSSLLPFFSLPLLSSPLSPPFLLPSLPLLFSLSSPFLSYPPLFSSPFLLPSSPILPSLSSLSSPSLPLLSSPLLFSLFLPSSPILPSSLLLSSPFLSYPPLSLLPFFSLPFLFSSPFLLPSSPILPSSLLPFFSLPLLSSPLSPPFLLPSLPLLSSPLLFSLFLPSSPILPSSLLPFFSLPLLSSPLLSSLSSPFPSSPILPSLSSISSPFPSSPILPSSLLPFFSLPFLSYPPLFSSPFLLPSSPILPSLSSLSSPFPSSPILPSSLLPFFSLPFLSYPPSSLLPFFSLPFLSYPPLLFSLSSPFLSYPPLSLLPSSPILPSLSPPFLLPSLPLLSPLSLLPCLLWSGRATYCSGVILSSLVLCSPHQVKVMVRVCPVTSSDAAESSSFLKVDTRKKQVTIMEPSANQTKGNTPQKRGGANQVPPKMFAFDAAFSHDASQAEVCAGTVAEVIQSVVNGADGCVFCFGHSKLGKSYTMIGGDESMQTLGIIPCAISWLFKLINERKEKTGARFSVRVSAVEVWGKEENLKDLLSEVATGSLQDSQSPGVYLCEDPICGMQLQNQSELRAPTPEKAAFFLDAAIAARYSNRADSDPEEHLNSHMLFTLHIYQYRMEKTGKGGMSGGRSRLHLIDLGSCVKVLGGGKGRDSSGSSSTTAAGLCLSLSALGNVILALVNGSKHIPYKDSKLSMLLRESLGNMNCRTTMIAHISSSPSNFSDTLSTIQIASRLLRMKKKKTKQYTSSSSGGESSCEEGRMRRPTHLRPFHSRSSADSDLPLLHLSSDPDNYSSSEQSCDTVIYVGPNGGAISDRELTDNEGPPEFVPVIPEGAECLKCNTFAELQERLECIDGSEEVAKFPFEEVPANRGAKTDTLVPPGYEMGSLQGTLSGFDTSSTVFGCIYTIIVWSFNTDLRKCISMKMYCITVKHIWVIEKSYIIQHVIMIIIQVYTQKGVMPGTPPLSCQSLSTADSLAADSVRSSTESLLQPVSLGEDELVFTLGCKEGLEVRGLLEGGGRPTSIISFSSDCSVTALDSGSRPISINSSISEDLEHYGINTTVVATTTRVIPITTASVAGVIAMAEVSMAKLCVEGEVMAAVPSRRSSISSWLSDLSVVSDGDQSLHSFSQSHGHGEALAEPDPTQVPLCGEKEQDEASLGYGGRKTPESEVALSGDVKGRETKERLKRLPPSLGKTTISLSDMQTLGASSNFLPFKTNITVHPCVAVKPMVILSSLTKTHLLPKDPAKTASALVLASMSSELSSDDPWMKRDRKWVVDPPVKTDPAKSSQAWPQGDRASRVDSGYGGDRHSSSSGEAISSPDSCKRVVDGSEMVLVSSGECLYRGLGVTSSTPCSPRATLDRRGYSGKHGLFSHQKGIPPLPPVRKSSLDQKNRAEGPLSPMHAASHGLSFLRSTPEDLGMPGGGKHKGCNVESSRLFSAKLEQLANRTNSLGRSHGGHSSHGPHYDCLSLERGEALSSLGWKVSAGGGRGDCTMPRTGRSLTRGGSLSSSSPNGNGPGNSPGSAPQSPKSSQSKISAVSKLLMASPKARSLSASSTKKLSFSTKSLPQSVNRSSSLPPNGKPQAQGQTSQGSEPGEERGAGGGGGGVGAQGEEGPLVVHTLPSPYSKITAPRQPHRCSSGHASDNSSVLSGELPPAMGKTALFYHSGGSSGYESMLRDSEATGSTSSAQDSLSEHSSATSSSRRSLKNNKKKNNSTGHQICLGSANVYACVHSSTVVR